MDSLRFLYVGYNGKLWQKMYWYSHSTFLVSWALKALLLQVSFTPMHFVTVSYTHWCIRRNWGFSILHNNTFECRFEKPGLRKVAPGVPFCCCAFRDALNAQQQFLSYCYLPINFSLVILLHCLPSLSHFHPDKWQDNFSLCTILCKP